MKRTTIILCLAAALTLATAGAALAAPPAAGAGTIFIFGEFAPLTLGSGTIGGLSAGAGINLGQAFTLGGSVQYVEDQPIVGAFANLSFAPFVLGAEATFPPAPETASFKVKGAYTLNLGGIDLGIGGGAVLADPEMDFFAEGSASIALTDAISLYAVADYFIEPQTVALQCGITYGF